MANSVETIYKGNFISNTSSPLNQDPVATDADKFSPVALLFSAYGSCLLGTMDYAARQNHFDVNGAKTKIDFEMDQNQNKVAKIDIKVFFESDFTDEQKQILEFAARNYCHVGKTIDPQIERTFEFSFDQH